MSSMLNTKPGYTNENLVHSPLSKLDIGQENTLIHFEQSYSGSVYLILGSFLMETPDSVEEAISMSKQYQEAARRCNKPVELIPTDCSFQITGEHISDWLQKRID